MDSSAGSLSPGNPDHSWLAFSLSNHYYQPTNPPQVHQLNPLCLFQHPQPPSPGEVGVENGATSHQQQHHHELSFLGGGGGGSGLLQVGLFPTMEVDAVAIANTGGGVIYEAVEERKPIATSFLGGFSVPQQHQQVVQQGEEERIIIADANKQQLAVVAASTAAVSSSNHKKGAEGFGHRTSIYRGVTRHRWTGRYEAHLWDNSCRREGQSRKGRQVYLGGYDKEEKAARAYDLAALKYWGPTTTTNFPISDYEKELEEMTNMSRQEFVASLRRKSSGFSRGASIYRGVTRHHQHGRWQARIGRVAGNKDLYLGTFSTQEEAAEAYDIAAIKFRGLNAVTNFDISRYDVKSIISSNLPVGGMSNKSRSDHSASDDNKVYNGVKSDGSELVSALPLITSPLQPATTPTLNFAIPIKPNSTSQNYNLTSLGPMDHNEAIGYNFGYVNQPLNGSGDSDNNRVCQEYNGCDGSNDNSNVTTSSGDNTWMVTPSLHSFQSAKPNLSVLQTPIFGIE